jgi:hypothetical protein
VLEELCNGCGICENVCPLEGKSGIEIFAVKDKTPLKEGAGERGSNPPGDSSGEQEGGSGAGDEPAPKRLDPPAAGSAEKAGEGPAGKPAKKAAKESGGDWPAGEENPYH